MLKSWGLVPLLAAALVVVPSTPASAGPADEASARGGCGARWPVSQFFQTPMRGSCAFAGTHGTFLHLAFSAGPNDASLQVKAYNSQGEPFWHNCGSAGSTVGFCKVPWGSNLANVDMRAQGVQGSSVINVEYGPR